MRYTINLTTRTHLDHQLLNRFISIMAIILFLIAVWNVSQVASNIVEQNRIALEIEAMQKKSLLKNGAIKESEINRQKSVVRFYNEIIARKSNNWLNILESFEKVTPEGISLSSLTPDKKSGDWKIAGRAKTFKGVQQYLETLESSKEFSNIILISHQNITTSPNERGVQFAISCTVQN